MIYIQQGPSWRPKCNDLFEKNLANGIIWNLRDEDIDKIKEAKNSDNYKSIIDFVDLKLYYKQFENSLLKKLNNLNYLPTEQITRLYLRDRNNLESIVNNTLKFQIENNFKIICIPALYITSFDERMIDAIFDMIVEYNKKINHTKKLYLNMIIHEIAFEGTNQMNSFLNELSSYKDMIDGIYLTVVRKDSIKKIRHDYSNSTLSNLMQFIYVLNQMNLETTIGYSGIEAINLIAVGLNNIATGWFYSLRKFDKEEKGLEPKESSGRAKKRYTSIGFLSELVIDENMKQYNVNKKDWLYKKALNNFELDKKILKENIDDISLNETYVEYFETMNKLCELINAPTIEERLQNLLNLIENAINNIKEYNNNVILDSKLTSQHLENYKIAIKKFMDNNFIEL